MRLFLIAVLWALIGPAVAASAATLQVYTDEQGLQADLRSYQVERFAHVVGDGVETPYNDYDIPAAFRYNGFTIIKTYARFGTGSLPGTWRGRPSSVQPDVIVFDAPITGWGAQILTQDGGNGTGILIFNGSDMVGAVGTGKTMNNAYFGFVSDTPFTEIVLLSGLRKHGKSGADTYRLDNMTFGNSVSVVPLPAGVWLLLSALAGLAIVRHRRP
ncbi:VPLPA-CTERM sorting domain-containing protein [Tropicimonas sp. S265A]|uniref:VPLPA-CTERM sorting domain-containing protein n=1 Tax=Tropicimonas sp. S265A TaxID=3415134 RepID=UPI003C7E425F